MPDKIQQEIEDLLARLDTFPPPKPWHVRLRESISRTVGGFFDAIGRLPFPRLSAGHVLLIAIATIVMAFLLLDSSGGVGRIIIVGAIVVFVAAFVLSLRRRGGSSFGGGSQQKYWRDKPIDLDKPNDRSWRDRRGR